MGYTSFKDAARQAEKHEQKDSVYVIPAKNGSIDLRILPGLVDGQDFAVTRIHRTNGQNYHCPREWHDSTGRFEGECPICRLYSWYFEDAKSLEHAGDKDKAEAQRAIGRNIKPSLRYYFNAIQRVLVKDETKQTNVGPMILSIPPTVFKILCDNIEGNLEEAIDAYPVLDLQKGKDFRYISKEKGGWPDHTSSKFLMPSKAGTPEEIKRWMGGLHDLAALRVVKSQLELRKACLVHLGKVKDTRAFNEDAEYQSYLQESGTAELFFIPGVEKLFDDAEKAQAQAQLASASLVDEAFLSDIPK